MQARILRGFFLGTTPAETLAADIANAMQRTGADSYRLRMQDLEGDFQVTGAHLVQLCDAALSGLLPETALTDLAFAMIASDHFHWSTDTTDGARVSGTLYDWSMPEVSFPLNASTIAKYRHRLLTGEDTFTPEDGRTHPEPRQLVWDATRDVW